MNPPAFVLIVLALSTAATAALGRRWTFANLMIPFVLLVPQHLLLSVEGWPELTPHRAVLVGMLVGCLISGAAGSLFPRFRALDWTIVAMIVSFSVSFGLRTDLKGFFHELATLGMDWGLPYIYARAIFKDVASFRALLKPIAVCGCILAFLSLYEMRMHDRLAANLWGALAGYPTPDYWLGGGGVRWGFLRAFGPFGHPLVLATILAAIAPLALCWGWLDKRKRTWSLLAAAFIAIGLLGPVSRGPVLVLIAVTILSTMAVFRIPAMILTVVIVVVGSLALANKVEEVWSATRTDLVLEGNTDSAKYRAALLMIYVAEFPKLGWFGNQQVVGAQYEQAWSIDNSFLYMYITGGWLGGTLFFGLVIATFVQGYRRLIRSRGLERKVRVGIMGSFVAMTGCIANVWFSPELSGLYLALVALVWNQRASSWYAAIGRPRARPVARPTATSGAVVRGASVG